MQNTDLNTAIKLAAGITVGFLSAYFVGNTPHYLMSIQRTAKHSVMAAFQYCKFCHDIFIKKGDRKGNHWNWSDNFSKMNYEALGPISSELFSVRYLTLVEYTCFSTVYQWSASAKHQYMKKTHMRLKNMFCVSMLNPESPVPYKGKLQAARF